MREVGVEAMAGVVEVGGGGVVFIYFPPSVPFCYSICFEGS